ncbi:Omega-6 fatty acid desaturase, endoplasmic reticulum isozyme 2 [Hordeum vulgare]|nr:Omega-6 fatty acid desaturase, endoplasmic reticulum isozyme 2 [Hordeum vulgare]
MADSGSESFTSRSVEHELVPRGPEEKVVIQLALCRSGEAAARRQRLDSQRRESIASAQPVLGSGVAASPKTMWYGRRNRVVVDVGSSQDGSVIDLTSTDTVWVTGSDGDE